MKIKKIVVEKQYYDTWIYFFSTHSRNNRLITISDNYSGHYECLRAAKAYAQAFKEVPVIVDKSKAK